jgi:hypothetical protein
MCKATAADSHTGQKILGVLEEVTAVLATVISTTYNPLNECESQYR